MNIACMSTTGQLRSLARRMAAEGHKVSLSSDTDELESTLIEELPSAIVFDSPVLGDIADSMSKRGVRVVGSSYFSRALVTIPDFTEKFLSLNSLSPVKHTHPYVISLAGWFNGWDIVGRHVTINLTKLWPGDLGTHVASSAVLITSKNYKYFELLNPIAKTLRSGNYRGPVFLDGQLSGKDFQVTGFSAHIKPHHLAVYADSFKGSLTDLLVSCAISAPVQSPELDYFSLGLTLSIAPWPYAQTSPDGEIEDAALGHVWEVLKNGLVGFVTARGTSVHECHRRVLRTIERCKITNPQYRNDTEGVFGKLLYNL